MFPCSLWVSNSWILSDKYIYRNQFSVEQGKISMGLTLWQQAHAVILYTAFNPEQPSLEASCSKQASIKSPCIHHRTQFRLLEGILPSNLQGAGATTAHSHGSSTNTCTLMTDGGQQSWNSLRSALPNMGDPQEKTGTECVPCMPRLYEKETVKIHIKSTRYIINTICLNYAITETPWKQYLFSYGTDEVTSSKLLTAEQGQTDKCLQANGMWHVRCKILSVWPTKIFQARQVPRATTQEMTKSLDDRRSRASWPT